MTTEPRLSDVLSKRQIISVKEAQKLLGTQYIQYSDSEIAGMVYDLQTLASRMLKSNLVLQKSNGGV